MTESTANYDETWKEAINDYFPSFMEFFFPDIYQLIDWTETPISLDKELQDISKGGLGLKSADKLYEVKLKDKSEIWILIHIEVQSQRDTDFPKRMFIYNYRSFDSYGKPVISLA
ncbi:MAG TPA: transposase, partial [Allocoleopsis sp.]